jgi:hypothetical protein
MINLSQLNQLASVGSMRDDSKIIFASQGSNPPKISGVQVHLSIAFNVGSNMQNELNALKKQCDEAFKN